MAIRRNRFRTLDYQALTNDSERFRELTTIAVDAQLSQIAEGATLQALLPLARSRRVSGFRGQPRATGKWWSRAASCDVLAGVSGFNPTSIPFDLLVAVCRLTVRV
jgi:hypothetical protein